MNQEEKRLYLIKYLLSENNKYSNVDIPSNEDEQKRLLRSLFNVRLPAPADEEFLKVQDEYLQEETRLKGIKDIKDLSKIEDKIYLWQGDITTLRCDAIVNAANSGLTGCYIPCHNCIDNIIHTYSGIQLRNECHMIIIKQGQEEETGQVKITSAYNLPSKYVIHTVGTIVNGNVTSKNQKELKSFYTQGDYGLFQSVNKNNKKTYDNEEIVYKMLEAQGFRKNEKGIYDIPVGGDISISIPTELIPICPDDGSNMTMNLRVDDNFVEDEGWVRASIRYNNFINKRKKQKSLLLELGVGMNTPVIIKYPFWKIVLENEKTTYACINYNEAFCPDEIIDRSIIINEDINKVLDDIMEPYTFC